MCLQIVKKERVPKQGLLNFAIEVTSLGAKFLDLFLVLNLKKFFGIGCIVSVTSTSSSHVVIAVSDSQPSFIFL